MRFDHHMPPTPVSTHPQTCKGDFNSNISTGMQDKGSIDVQSNGAWDYFINNVKAGQVIVSPFLVPTVCSSKRLINLPVP